MWRTAASHTLNMILTIRILLCMVHSNILMIKVRILSQVVFGHRTVTSTILEPVSYGDIFVLGSKAALLRHTDSVTIVIFRLGQLKISQSAAIPTGSAWR